MSESNILPSNSKHTRYQLREDAKPIDDGAWVWPLPRLAGEHPRIVTQVGGKRCTVELGYEHVDFSELFVPVYAAQGGTISYAARTPSGCAVSIEHGGAW